MNNSIAMTADFNRQKNIQASLYTAGITGALLLLVLFIKFYQPVVQVPPAEEYIEINLGSSDVGMGNDQPELPGDPAPEQQAAYTPAQPVTNAAEESVKDIEESNDAEATPVYKPTVTKTDAKRLNEESKVVKTKPTTVTATPTPAPVRPRAVMGQVRGGNGAATYKLGTGEGQGGGPGDQGSVGGNPNGRDYTPRTLQSKVVSMPGKSFEDDFSESGKIVLDISVDENGRLLSATYQPRGSSISNRAQIQIAQRRARELSYPKYPGGFKQPHVFVFDVK